jgi:hypothetical protein
MPFIAVRLLHGTYTDKPCLDATNREPTRGRVFLTPDNSPSGELDVCQVLRLVAPVGERFVSSHARHLGRFRPLYSFRVQISGRFARPYAGRQASQVDAWQRLQ